MCEVWVIQNWSMCSIKNYWITSCWLTDNTKTKLTLWIDDVWVVHSWFHQRKWRMRNELFRKILINNKHWNKLTNCMMMCKHSKFYQKKMNHDTQSILNFINERKTLKPPHLLFHWCVKCAGREISGMCNSKSHSIKTCRLTDLTQTELTRCIDGMWCAASKIIKLASYWWIHNIKN